MYICMCNALTDRDIRRAADQGHRTVTAAYCSLGAELCCGKCKPVAKKLITEQIAGARPPAMAAE